MTLEVFPNLSNNSMALSFSLCPGCTSPEGRALFPLCTRACHLCTRCVFTLHWVLSPLHTALVPLGTGRCPSAQRFLSPLHTVHHSLAQSARPVCTGHLALLHTGYVSATHRHPSAPWDSHRARKSGAECSPMGSSRAARLGAHPEPLCPGSPGRPEGIHGHSNHLGKLSWAFLRGAGKAHQLLLESRKGSPHPPTIQSCPQAESISCFIKK